MKRRSFLGLLGGVFAAPAVKAEPVEEIMTVTTEEYFPDPNRAFANRVFTPSIWSKEMDRHLISAGDRFTIEGNPTTFEVVA